MTLPRSLTLTFAATLAVTALAAVPGTPDVPGAPPSEPRLITIRDDGPPAHVDPAQPGVDLGAAVPTSELVRRAGVAGGASRDRDVRALSASPFADLAGTPAGRPGLRGLVEHVTPSCTGTGRDGNRVQVVYAVESGQPDRYDQVLAAVQSYVADVDDTFAMSSRESGRRVRWVADSSCVPVVDHAVVPPGTLARPDMVKLKTALSALGYRAADRKYLVFADAAELCGVADVYLDDRRTPWNRNNGGVPMYARVDTPCWAVPSGGHSTPAHELMHMLGAVQPSAPNATAYGHCTDERDAMCYADGDGQRVRQVCTQPDDEQLFDCGRDDYFDPRLRPVSTYLRTHWNTADSSFLDRISADSNAQGLPPVVAMSGPSRLRPGLAAPLSVRSDRPVTVTWRSSMPECLDEPAGPEVRLQCPTDVAGSVTVTATATADDGTQARVSRRVLLSDTPARLTVTLDAVPEVDVDAAGLLVAVVTYNGLSVRGPVVLQQYAGRTRGWVTLDTAVTDAQGRVEFTVRRSTVGLRTYRVQVRTADGSGWQTSTSPSATVDVV